MWAGAAQSVPALSAPIPPQPLAQALVEFAHQTGLQLLYESKLAVQRQSNEAAQGLSAAAALTEILRGTGLNFQFLNPKTVRIYEPAAVAPAVQPSATDIPKPRAEPAAPRVDALEEVIVEIGKGAEAFVLSLGYDIVESDPHGSWDFSQLIFMEIGEVLAYAGLPVCVVQEGGYALDALANCSEAFAAGILMEEDED